MIQFPDCFLLIFGELAVGGFFCLSVPPFNEIERGFYKSSAAVFLAAALAMAAGKLALLVRATAAPSGAVVEAMAWTVFAAVASLYLYSLWGDPYRLRARAYLGTLVTGLVALVASALRFRLGAAAPVVEALLYPLSFILSAATFGAATAGMLLGHWYLIDTGMSLVPLERLLRTFVVSLAGQLTLLVLTILLLALPASSSAAEILGPHLPLLATRVTLGPLAALGIAAMIHRTLAIPQTMAATGLFYIAVLAVAVGEMLSRLLLLRTSLPL